MRTGRGWGFPLVAVSLFGCLLTACAGSDDQQRPPGSTPSPIAVSISAKAIYLVDATTGSRREIVGDLPDFRSGYAVWSPDRQAIAYARDGIEVLDPTANRSTTFVRGDELSMPTWDPDGTHLAYSDGLTIWLTSLGKVSPTRIHVPAILGPVDLAWSPSGVIAFEGVNLDCSLAVRCVSTGSSEIWTIHPDGTSLVRVTNVGHAETPKWSPDGSRLLFVRRYPSTSGKTEVWTADASGADARRLLAVPGVVAADWSPDESKLAMIAEGTSPGTLQLWVGRSDGTGLERVGTPFQGTHASIDW
jgi:Tol biopolymer transport system component